MFVWKSPLVGRGLRREITREIMGYTDVESWFGCIVQRKDVEGMRNENVQTYPTAQPQRWPRRLVEGTKIEIGMAITRGVIQVGIL